jgi:SAM-dependent methyltransferase
VGASGRRGVVSGLLAPSAARLVYATTLIDRAYRKFDDLRSSLILSFGSDPFFEAYGALAYTAPEYLAGTPQFRRDLFAWEERAFREFLPPPPARILVGGAGGGREAFVLARRGYEVVAFEPAPALAQSMRHAAIAGPLESLHSYCASYRDLPILPAWEGAPSLDLRTTRLDAIILGWTSFSHILDDEARVATLARCGTLTAGPILISFFPRNGRLENGVRGRGIRGMLQRRARRRGPSMFAPAVGFARLLDQEDVRGFVLRAGLCVVHADSTGEFPYTIVQLKEGSNRPGPAIPEGSQPLGLRQTR